MNAFREKNIIPAVVYGHKIDSQNLWVSYLDFKKVFDKAGESTVIELDIEKEGKRNALIHEVQVDPVSDKITHIDFFQIRMDEKIEAEIPLEFIGESPAVKETGGILIKNIDEIMVSCLPADLPPKIEVNISKIKTFDDHIKIKDLDISPKVKVLVEEDTVVALVSPPRSDEEIAALEDKVEEDVTKVEGVVKEEPAAEAEKSVEPKEKK